MGRILLEGMLEMEYPDTFREMTAEEAASYAYDKKLVPQAGIADTEGPMTVTFICQKIKGFGALSASPKDMAMDADVRLKKLLKKNSYAQKGFYQVPIDETKGMGVTYDYSIDGIKMIGYLTAAKANKLIVIIHAQFRESDMERDFSKMKELINSAKWRMPEVG